MRRPTAGSGSGPISGRSKMRSMPLQFEARYRELLSAVGKSEGVDVDDGSPPPLSVKGVTVSVAVLREMLEASVLGPFQRVFEKVVEDILRAVYSDEVTTSALASVSSVATLDNVPYFEIVNRNAKEIEELRDSNARLGGRVHELEEELRHFKALGQQQYKPNELEARVLDLEYKLAVTGDDLHACKVDYSNLVAEKARDLSRLEHEVESWKNNAQGVSNKLNDLESKRRYLKELHMKFSGLRFKERIGKRAPAEEIARLLNQLCLLQNAVMEEFESMMEGALEEKGAALKQSFISDVSMVQVRRDATWHLALLIPLRPPPNPDRSYSFRHATDPSRRLSLSLHSIPFSSLLPLPSSLRATPIAGGASVPEAKPGGAQRRAGGRFCTLCRHNRGAVGHSGSRAHRL